MRRDMAWSRRVRVVLLPAVMAAALLPAPAHRAVAADDPSDALRPCRRADLIGVWAMIRLGRVSSARVDPSDPILSPYQRFAFRSDGGLRHLGAAIAVGPEEQQAILTAPATTTWSVDQNGRLLAREAGAAAPEIDACQVVLTKVSDPRSPIPGLPGDVLLTHYGHDGKPVARRLLRKMSGPGE